MHEAVWESLQAELQSPVAELSPSQLWMRLVLLRKHRASPPVWLTSTLAPKHHEALGQILMVRQEGVAGIGILGNMVDLSCQCLKGSMCL